MNKRIQLLILYLLLGHLTAHAQGSAEKIYVQTDRNYYAKGETIHFKAFILSDADTVESSNLFLELWDTSFKKLAAVISPVIDATSSGSLTIPADLSTDHFFLRAYTDITSIQDPPFQFIRSIGISSAKTGISEEGQGTPFQPLFFPEGGKLVYHANNYVAFKAPLAFSGTIRNSKGDLVTSIKPVFNGMGVFKFRPVQGETYFCHWKRNGDDSVLALPVPAENGIALHVDQRDDTLFFDIDKGRTKTMNIQKPRVQLMIDNEISYMIDLTMHGNAKFSYFIPLRAFRPGMAELRVLDDESKILARRPVFILRKKFYGSISMDIIKKDLGTRGNNFFRLNFNDTTLKSISVSITDAAYNNITPGYGLMSVLLPAGMPSLPPQKDPGTFPELDLALLTLDDPAPGEIKIQGPLPVTPPKYLQLSGVVTKGKKLITTKEIFIGIRSEQTGKELYKVMTDDQGRFQLNDLILYGEAYVHGRLPGNNEDEISVAVKLSTPMAPGDMAFFNAFKQRAISMHNTGFSQPARIVSTDNSTREDTIVFGEKAITLEEVVLRVDTKHEALRRLEEAEKKYTHGTSFGGYSAQAETLDVINDPVAGTYNNIFVYMAAKLHMAKLKYFRGREEMVYPLRGIGGDTIIRSYYLNGNKIARDLIDGIRLEEVALIKFIPMFAIEPGMPPSIAIFLRKPGDEYYRKKEYLRPEQKITGYPLSMDLPMPDYSNNDIKVQGDSRKTLLWQPYTVVNNGIAEIKFYNNDVTKKIRIVVEGIAADGSMLFYEKLLE